MTDEPFARSVAEQHRRLDALFDEVLVTLRDDEPGVAGDAFARLREALEGHVDHEDRLYHPVLAALRPEHRAVLDGLLAAHAEIRARLGAIDAQLGARDRAAAERALGEFARAFAAHEAVEEQLLERLDATLREV